MAGLTFFSVKVPVSGGRRQGTPMGETANQRITVEAKPLSGFPPVRNPEGVQRETAWH